MTQPDGGPPGPNFMPPPVPDGPSAFADEGYSRFNQSREYYNGCGWYTTVGIMALQRQQTVHTPLILADPGNLDTGIVPPATAPLLQDIHDIRPEMRGGIQAAVGYFWDDSKIELSGFYLPQSKAQVSQTVPGQLDSFFFNPPLGFEGDNGLWLQADTIRTSLRTELANGELNYHCWSCLFTGLHPLVGIRYFDLNERLQIATSDDSVMLGLPDPLHDATYTVRAQNQLLAAQLGVEYNQPILSWMGITATAKGAWGVDFAQIDYYLERGDGFVGLSSSRSETIFSQLYEVGVFLDFYMGSRWHLRGGYQALWIYHVPVASSQLDFDLSQLNGVRNDNGSVFFQGPTLELQMLW
jgi:hypothetical protein